MESGGSAMWLAEFRECTIMFVALSGLDYSKPDKEVMALLTACVTAVQVITNNDTLIKLITELIYLLTPNNLAWCCCFEGAVAHLINDNS